MRLKTSSVKWRPFCPGEDELTLSPGTAKNENKHGISDGTYSSTDRCQSNGLDYSIAKFSLFHGNKKIVGRYHPIFLGKNLVKIFG